MGFPPQTKNRRINDDKNAPKSEITVSGHFLIRLCRRLK